MAFDLTFQPILIEFTLEEREAWRAGERSACNDRYAGGLRGTMGFGEFLTGRYWERLGYKWIHHDYNVFGGNKPGKYPESEAILREALGSERLDACRDVFKALTPFREAKHYVFEEPDLLVYKPGTKEIRFAESKRQDTHDKINRRQALGLYHLGSLLACPVDVFFVAEKGTCTTPAAITFRYPEAG